MAPDPISRRAADVQATYAATLVDEWIRCGVEQAVVCPGSRSTPLAVALARRSELALHVCHDERSGGFIALGIGTVTRRPALVLTTSGTAAVELHPAIVEAHHGAVPMLAVTADRPSALRGTGAPQTIDQRNLYGTAVRAFLEPGVVVPAGADGWRHLAVDAYESTIGVMPGPVHLNLEFDEPLLGAPGVLDDPDPAAASGPGDVARLEEGALDDLVGRLGGRRGVVVAGGRAAIDDGDRLAIAALAETLGWPVLADHLSGCRVGSHHVAHTDPILRHAATARALAPEVVLRIGGLHASRVLNEWMTRSGAIHVGLDRYGMIPDPDRVVDLRLAAGVGETCRLATDAFESAGASPVDGGRWVEAWQRADATAADAIGSALAVDRLDEVTTAVAIVASSPPGTTIVVSSSMPIRDLEWYVEGRADIDVVSNRGANGIDGVLSTAIGVALTGRPTICVLGDIAFLHDASALTAIARRSIDLTIIVIDNDGGGIFSFLPQHEALPPAEFDRLFGTPHGTDLERLASAHAVAARRLETRRGLDSALRDAGSVGGTRMLIVASDRDTNRAHHAALNAIVGEALERLR